jgi:hypothetical protein
MLRKSPNLFTNLFTKAGMGKRLTKGKPSIPAQLMARMLKRDHGFYHNVKKQTLF